MKHLLHLLFLTLSGTTLAQITSGTVVYEESTLTKRGEEFPNSFSSNTTQTEVSFNERFISTKELNNPHGEHGTIVDNQHHIQLDLRHYEDSVAEYNSTLPTGNYYRSIEKPEMTVLEFPNDKVILGYSCKRTVFQFDKDFIVSVWSTDQLPALTDIYPNPVPTAVNFKETVLESVTESTNYTWTQKVISISPLKEQLSIVPPVGYVLHTSSIGLEHDNYYHHDTIATEIIDYPVYAKGWDELKKQLIKVRRKTGAERKTDYGLVSDYLYIVIEIGTDGSVLYASASNDKDNLEFENEALKILKEANSWTPAKVEGTPVTSRLVIYF